MIRSEFRVPASRTEYHLLVIGQDPVARIDATATTLRVVPTATDGKVVHSTEARFLAPIQLQRYQLVGRTWHRNPSSSQRFMHSPRPSPVQGRNQTASAPPVVRSHDHAIIHSCSAPTASGSVLESTLARSLLAGDGPGRLIAVEVEAERNHRAAVVDGAKSGGARPRLIEPQQGVARTLGDLLHYAAQRRNACRGGPSSPALTPSAPMPRSAFPRPRLRFPRREQSTASSRSVGRGSA